MMDYFRADSSQVINCTGTENQMHTNQHKETKIENNTKKHAKTQTHTHTKTKPKLICKNCSQFVTLLTICHPRVIQCYVQLFNQGNFEKIDF